VIQVHDPGGSHTLLRHAWPLTWPGHIPIEECHTWFGGSKTKWNEFYKLMFFFDCSGSFFKSPTLPEIFASFRSAKMLQPHNFRSLQLGQQHSHSARLGTAYDASRSVAGLVQAPFEKCRGANCFMISWPGFVWVRQDSENGDFSTLVPNKN